MSIDLEQFLASSGIRRELFERWVENEWVLPARTAVRIELTSVDVARALLVRDLTDDMGVNDEGVDVALHLLDQIHGLRQLLASLRGELERLPR